MWSNMKINSAPMKSLLCFGQRLNLWHKASTQALSPFSKSRYSNCNTLTHVANLQMLRSHDLINHVISFEPNFIP